MSTIEAQNEQSQSSLVAIAQGVMKRLEHAWNAADGAGFARRLEDRWRMPTP